MCRILGLVFAIWVGMCGCSSTQKAKYPKDPLFVRKEPIQTQAVSAPPKPPEVYNLPTAPPVPPIVLASSQQLIAQRNQHGQNSKSKYAGDQIRTVEYLPPQADR